MLQLCIILLVVGVLAILLEMLMPGFDSFISGIVGVLALAASVVLAVLFVDGGWLIVAINLGVIITAALMFIAFIRRKQFHGRMVLSDALSEDTPQINLNSLIGREGTATSALRPYGEAIFDGMRVEVSSCGGVIIERGTNIRVIDIQGNKVIVSAVQ